MYDSTNENQLILNNIVDAMSDYVSIQLDIDDTKVKAAALVAQNLDIKKVIKKVNVERCIEGVVTTKSAEQVLKDKELRALVIPPLCYYTYSRCLLMFQGTFTDSGYTIEDEGEARNAAKSVAREMKAIADTFMDDVLEFLEEEAETNEEVEPEKLTARIRTFGGKENRGSN